MKLYLVSKRLVESEDLEKYVPKDVKIWLIMRKGRIFKKHAKIKRDLGPSEELLQFYLSNRHKPDWNWRIPQGSQQGGEETGD